MTTLENALDVGLDGGDDRSELQDESFEIDSLTEQQQIRLTHVLDEYLKSLEQGTSFDAEEICRDEPALQHALAIYRNKLNSLYGLSDTGQQNRSTIPKSLGAFTLIREIGRGGMGIVYEATQSGMSLTRSGDVIGTLRYMSPEQACGKSAWVDGRTDIYSLAVTVYEMLALRPACSGDDGPSILKAIDQTDFIPLRHLRESIPRDLETVIAKAMSKPRDQRYETSQAFADDLRRVLADEPTVARPPTLVDRISRFGARHKRAALVAIAVCAMGFVGFAISTALIAAEKRVSDAHANRAEQSEKLARGAVDRLGSQMAELLSDIPSAEPVRRRLLRETLDYYEKFATGAANAPGLRHDLAITYGKIGTLQGELSSDENAIDALRRSERLYGELAGEASKQTQAQLDWSISQNNLAESLHRAGELEEAAVYFTRAIKTQERLAEKDLDPVIRMRLSTTLNNLGLLLSGSGAIDEAESSYLRAVNLLRTVESPSVVSKEQQLATVLANLSALLAKSRPEVAIAHAKEALANQTTALEIDGGNVNVATQVIVTLQTLGSAYSSNQNNQAAIGSYEKAVEIGRQLLARWPNQAQYRRDQVISLNHLGLAFSKSGQLPEARRAFEQALKYQRPLAEHYSGDAETHSMLGGVLNNLGFLFQQLGDSKAAASSYAEAVQQQALAARLAPQVERYQNYLRKHQYNLAQLEEGS